MWRETGTFDWVSVCVSSLLESAIVFNTCVTVCMCVCMQCMYIGPILWTQHVYLCTKWMYFNSSALLIKESLQEEAIRSMAGKIWKKVRHLSSSKVRKNIF